MSFWKQFRIFHTSNVTLQGFKNPDSQTLNIALPRSLVKKVDALAKEEYRNRSELIREALFAYLKDKAEWQQIYATGERAMEKMGIKSKEEIDQIVYEYRHGRKAR